jgi:RimJ/RimL family protein N-acetyltransferase
MAGCHPENEASKKVLLKSGFSFVENKWFDDTQREEPCFEITREPTGFH